MSKSSFCQVCVLILLMEKTISSGISLPRTDINGQESDKSSVEDDDTEDHHLQVAPQSRYVGYCKDAFILMWPGNSRKFWSYGYLNLGINYLRNCSLKYEYSTRANPSDTLVKYGFKVTGTFYGLDNGVTSGDCSGTDYIMLNDTIGNVKYYCGPSATIEWTTINDNFIFNFETLPYSPTARGFFVVIQSFAVCGGTYYAGSVPSVGNLTSPLYPDSYPNDVSCAYYFYATDIAGTSIAFKCDFFDLEDPVTYPNGSTLCVDYTQFQLEMPHTTATTYCGDALNANKHTVWSLHNDLLLYFRSNGDNQEGGYSCQYQFYVYGDKK